MAQRYLFVLLLLLLCGAGTAAAEEVSRIVATINNDAVTSVQLDKAMAAQEAPGISRSDMLDRLVEESLMRQRAEELGLKVTDDEVEAAVQDVMRQNRLSQEQLDAALKQQGIAPDEYRDSLRRQILRYKLLGRDVPNRADVASSEIQNYYQEHQADYREEPAIGLKRISFVYPAKAKKEEKSRLIAQAAALRADLIKGKSFDEVLAAAGKDAEGGETGTIPFTDLTPAFADAVRNLPAGGISEVIENERGAHILIVSELHPGRVRPLDEVREAIRNRLADDKKGSAAKRWMDDLKKKAQIETRL